MSQPVTLPSGRVEWIACNQKWLESAPEKERQEFLESIEALINAAEKHMDRKVVTHG